jgi:hypothetical protein
MSLIEQMFNCQLNMQKRQPHDLVCSLISKKKKVAKDGMLAAQSQRKFIC